MQRLKKNKVSALLIVACGFILANCAGEISNADTEQLILPTLFQYSTEEQQSLADELESGSCNVADKFIEDYGIIREQIRDALK